MPRSTSSSDRGPRGRSAHGAAPWLLHSILPLSIGGLLYVGWRSRELAMWSWARAIGIADAASGLRAALRALGEPPEWLRFTIPDVLWVYALTWSVARLQRGSRPFVKAAWLLVPAALGPGAELLQAVGLLPGTFDALDLAGCALAFGLGAWRGGASTRATDGSVRA